MAYHLELSPAAQRDLRKLDPHIRRKINSDLLQLEKDLVRSGRRGSTRNYRVVYQITDEVLLVLIVRVGDRKEVYRRLK